MFDRPVDLRRLNVDDGFAVILSASRILLSVGRSRAMEMPSRRARKRTGASFASAVATPASAASATARLSKRTRTRWCCESCSLCSAPAATWATMRGEQAFQQADDNKKFAHLQRMRGELRDNTDGVLSGDELQVAHGQGRQGRAFGRKHDRELFEEEAASAAGGVKDRRALRERCHIEFFFLVFFSSPKVV